MVVMPNHVHLIIGINDCIDIVGTGEPRPVGTGRDLSLRGNDFIIINKIKPISQLIGAFKTSSSKLIHKCGLEEFFWQRSFHDHIIGDDNEYDRIVDYILSNPSKWDEDRNNPRNIPKIC
jgi:REP element-mobilizing transposase RayT